MDIKIHLYTCVYLLATTTLHIKAIIYVISNATKQKQERQNKHFFFTKVKPQHIKDFGKKLTT